MTTRRTFVSLALIFALIASTLVFAQEQRRRQTQQPRRGLGVKPNNTPSGKRFALIIGNAAYQSAPLTNPINDARAIAEALRACGFDVIARENVTQNQMKQAIRQFGEKLRAGGDGSIGLFYYAGHGVQVRDRNYLVPIGATVQSEEEVEYESVDVGLVTAQMEAAQNGLNIVILDACRDNPFARSFRSSSGSGLAQVNAPTGTLIAYATAPGKTASDGSGRNGLYTQELLGAIRTPGMAVEEVFKRVRIGVRDKSRGKQVPWESSSLVGDFYFTMPEGEANTTANATKREPSKVPLVDTEAELWEQIRGNASADDLRDYLKEYPTGAHAAVARVMLRRLETPNGANNAGNNTGGNTTSAKPSSAAKPRTVQNRYGIELVYIPSGSFSMGSTNGDADEKPAHQVTINYSFYMGRTEVTQAQWQAVMGNNPSHFKGDNLPVETVSWEDAQQFISKLNELNDGYKYRLPSEAEWEYACRAGTTGDYYASDPDDIAWYSDNSGKTTHPVGTKQANGFGLSDMSGNVWEWCRDEWHENYNGAPTDGSSWLSGGDSSSRVLRGGSWDYNSANVRSALRSWVAPDVRSFIIGFRLVAVSRT